MRGDGDDEGNPNFVIRQNMAPLYRVFRPSRHYWMVVIILRKALVAVLSLAFYTNATFQMSTTLFVIFASYVVQVKNRPFVTDTECDMAVAAFKQRAMRIRADRHKKKLMKRRMSRVLDRIGLREYTSSMSVDLPRTPPPRARSGSPELGNTAFPRPAGTPRVCTRWEKHSSLRTLPWSPPPAGDERIGRSGV